MIDTAMNAAEVDSRKAPRLSVAFKNEKTRRWFGTSNPLVLKAILRLGVTEDEIAYAERLFRVVPATAPEQEMSKFEQVLGYTETQMSFLKALHLLGLTEASVLEERSRALGALGGYSNQQSPSTEAAADAGYGGCRPVLCPGCFGDAVGSSDASIRA